MRKWLTDTFAFAVWERNAFLALVVIAITIAFGPAIYSVVFPPSKNAYLHHEKYGGLLR
jgi:hypothetical protein